MKKTKIESFDATWNPVTGCLRGCRYCYAKGIAERFAGYIIDMERRIKLTTVFEREHTWDKTWRGHTLAVVDDCQYRETHDGDIAKAPYPIGFMPTLHRYKMGELSAWKKPRTIFVCSMADLFGPWVPDTWIEEVFAACEAAPQHRYMFLTKFPGRYLELQEQKKLVNKANFWYGTTVTSPEQYYYFSELHNTFLSIEPILEDFPSSKCLNVDWVIVGAETGHRKERIEPEKKWIDHIQSVCHDLEIPLFMKDTLRGLMAGDFEQKFPWEV